MFIFPDEIKCLFGKSIYVPYLSPVGMVRPPEYLRKPSGPNNTAREFTRMDLLSGPSANRKARIILFLNTIRRTLPEIHFSGFPLSSRSDRMCPPFSVFLVFHASNCPCAPTPLTDRENETGSETIPAGQVRFFGAQTITA